MENTRDNAFIAAGFAVVAFAPLGWFRRVLLGLAAFFLLLANRLLDAVVPLTAGSGQPHGALGR